MTALDAKALRRYVAEAANHAMAYRYKAWGFGEGPALLGLLLAADLLDRPDYIDAVERVVRPTLTRPPAPTDHLIPVETLTSLARHRTDLKVQQAIDHFTDAVLHAARPVPGRLPVHRPDHPELGSLVWVDCMHTDGPGLALAGYSDAAVTAMDEVAGVLQEDSGLFCHGHDVVTGTTNGVHWARGQGWALHGLVGTARLVGALGQPLLRRIHALLTALAEYEVDGCFRTVVDDPDSPIENSLSPMVAAAVTDGLRHRLVSSDFQPLADRCLRHTVAALEDGALPVSAATPVGPARAYRACPTGTFPWGQGPVLMALCSAIDHAKPPGPENTDSMEASIR